MQGVKGKLYRKVNLCIHNREFCVGGWTVSESEQRPKR